MTVSPALTVPAAATPFTNVSVGSATVVVTEGGVGRGSGSGPGVLLRS